MNRENKPYCLGIFHYINQKTFNPQQAYDELCRLQNIDTAQQTDQNENFVKYQRFQRDNLRYLLNLPTDDKMRKRKICFLNKLRTKCYTAMKEESTFKNLSDLISKYESEVNAYIEHLAKPVEKNKWRKKVLITAEDAKKVIFSSEQKDQSSGPEDTLDSQQDNEHQEGDIPGNDFKIERQVGNKRSRSSSQLPHTPANTKVTLLKEMLKTIEEKMAWKRKKKNKMKEILYQLFESI